MKLGLLLVSVAAVMAVVLVSGIALTLGQVIAGFLRTMPR